MQINDVQKHASDSAHAGASIACSLEDQSMVAVNDPRHRNSKNAIMQSYSCAPIGCARACNPMTRLAGRIRKARLSVGMSQSALAACLGVTRGAVANWESVGGVLPATEASFEWLATGRGASKHASSHEDVPAADMQIVEDRLELRLLHAFRAAPQRQQARIVEAVESRMVASIAESRA